MPLQARATSGWRTGSPAQPPGRWRSAAVSSGASCASGPTWQRGWSGRWALAGGAGPAALALRPGRACTALAARQSAAGAAAPQRRSALTAWPTRRAGDGQPAAGLGARRAGRAGGARAGAARRGPARSAAGRARAARRGAGAGGATVGRRAAAGQRLADRARRAAGDRPCCTAGHSLPCPVPRCQRAQAGRPG
jgi:hypothetical protein